MEMQREHGGITRRSFVGASAAAMAGLALVGCQPENKLEKTEGEAAGATAVDAELDPSVEGKWVTACCNNNCGGMCLNKVYVVDGVVVRQKTDDTAEDSPASPQLRACPRGRSKKQHTFGADRTPAARRSCAALTSGCASAGTRRSRSLPRRSGTPSTPTATAPSCCPGSARAT